MLRRRQALVALLFAATAISYVDRQTLSVVAPRLRDELNISNFDYARIVFAFLLAYTIMQPVTGWLMDRLGSRRGFAIIMAWWSAATVFHALGQGVASFSLLRFLLGVGQAGSWAASVRAVAEWFPPHARGGPNGVWGAGTSVGSIVAIPLVAWLTVAFGWRAAFVVTGVAGFVWVAAWLALDQVPAGSAMPASGGEVDAARSSDRPAPWPLLDLLRERSLWALVLARLFADPIVWFYNAWVPEYLARSAGFSMTEVGRYGWIPFFANGLGIVLGGAASDWLCRRHWPVIRARLTVMGLGALVMTAGVIAALPVPVSVALTAISLAVFGFGLWAPNMMSLGADAFPPGNAGSVTGLSGMGAGIGGMAYTLFTGWTLDRFGYAPVFLTSGIAPLIAFAVLYTLLDGRPVCPPPPPAAG